MPFLFDVLGIPWCDANNEYTDAAIIRGAARNRDIIRRLKTRGRATHPRTCAVGTGSSHYVKLWT
jgi:hypothetical protein